jgi:hypothetical protein
MRATIAGLSAVLLAMTLTTAAQAWYEYRPPPVNAFTPSCCYPCWDGGYYGPCNNWPPCCEPFQGFRPPISRGPTHPFARSPRDYFMIDP